MYPPIISFDNDVDEDNDIPNERIVNDEKEIDTKYLGTISIVMPNKLYKGK